MKLENLKGTKDFLPKEQTIRENVRRKLESTFETYGFMPVETPTICYFDLLSYKYGGGDEILKEVYRLKDQGNRDLGLRYDLTVPFTKIIGMNPYLKMPFKRYEIGKVFRDGPVKKGRLREFTQCDVDVVGVKSMMAEAELMSMVFDVFDKLKLDVYIYYNNRKLLYGILESIGTRKEDLSNIVLSLDKIKKIGSEGVIRELIEKGIGNNIIEKLKKLIEDKNINDLEYLLENYKSPKTLEGIDELKNLNSYLQELDLLDKVKFNPFLARGLDIYTGTIYEVFLSDGSITSSIGSGGRYDNIIGSFLNNNKEYPAVGLSFGLDVIYTALLDKNQNINKPLVDLIIIPMGRGIKTLKIANDIRKLGVKVDIDMTNKKLGKKLKGVDKRNIPYVIIIGEDELKNGKVKIKNMKTGKEEEVEIENIGGYVKGN
ncbi:histidine--tRNA ligase [Dethiothermospora halolimnae]|uniref:histidine--tRNA ligase n=1 Tax=Dethiothermospora halolimnae TaxID=3114390 RepID=UPI003CCBE6A7